MSERINSLEGVLRDHAEGRIAHLGRGSCPDSMEGHDSRDPECRVCQALATLAEQAKPVALKHWTFCPECGCEGSRPTGYGTGRYCSDCGQEWFTDIDYLDTCRTNLHSLFRRTHPAPDAGLRARLAGLEKDLVVASERQGLYSDAVRSAYRMCLKELRAILATPQGEPR
jgi:hypothetical protein